MSSLPSGYAFHDVARSTQPQGDGRALEQIHKLLQVQPSDRFAVRDGTLSTESTSAKPLLLLGIMSGNEGRRRLLRCSWSRTPEAIRLQVRVLFVVGSSRALASEWELNPDPASMELRANISEGVRVWKPRLATLEAARKHQSFTGTFSTYFKQAVFLRFAASQPEPLIGRADDDAFISPHMLLAYATILHQLGHPVYAGVFEWISWRATRLEATGFSYGLPEARGRAKAPHRNCSRTVPDPVSAAHDHMCLGPFACALQPCVELNSPRPLPCARLAHTRLVHGPQMPRAHS
jgi:hypothetical protein